VVSRQPKGKKTLEVKAMFEPSRFAQNNIVVAYDLVAPVARRSAMRVTTNEAQNNSDKMTARQMGGAQ
jgi:hypothetical protein